MMHANLQSFALVLAVVAAPGSAQIDGPIPVPATDVRIRDRFWARRLETNRRVTVPFDLRKCAQTGRLSNFEKAAGLTEGEFEGLFFNDSDVYKVIEGAAYTLSMRPDARLEAYLDRVIARIAAAQQPDGYLNTYFTLAEPEKRWADLGGKHELYCAGHLFEAAVAYSRATGKRALLDVALEFADHIERRFGPQGIRGVPGHQEIEIGLVKLYRETGEQRYLDLAEFFLEERGRPNHRDLYGEYAQDHAPVVEQREAVGHAVRAGYMYSGMADVAALTGNTEYVEALDRLWANVVGKKMYLTGGVGSERRGEAFGTDYELPNLSAYNETCAAIAFAMWNHRMFLLHEDARYIDVLERVLYNGFLAGVSLRGDRFFYPNPLEADGNSRFNMGSATRQEWFDCSCCPVNVVRFMPSIAGYVYARKDDIVFANLFIGSEAELDIGGRKLRIVQRTEYPWDGRVSFEVHTDTDVDFALCVRIPGWALGRPVTTDLYRYVDPTPGMVRLFVNGADVPMRPVRGFARLRRKWKDGDQLVVDLQMPVRRVIAHPLVFEDRGRVALERGPIVYCVEGVDHGGFVRDLALGDDVELGPRERSRLLGHVTILRGTAKRLLRSERRGAIESEDVRLTAIPYYAWSNRGAGPMAVWLPREVHEAVRRPDASIEPSASHVWRTDTVTALNDEFVPTSSIDESIPRLTWWDHRGTREWVRYDFDEPREVSEVEVYWFDDRGRGGCRVPASWQVQWMSPDSAWHPVSHPSPYGVAADRFNRVTFESIEVEAIRIVARLRPGYSGGVLEWRVR